MTSRRIESLGAAEFQPKPGPVRQGLCRLVASVVCESARRNRGRIKERLRVTRRGLPNRDEAPSVCPCGRVKPRVGREAQGGVQVALGGQSVLVKVIERGDRTRRMLQ